MALVSILEQAIGVEVSGPQETPEETQCEPCYRCSLMGNYDHLVMGEKFTMLPACEPCAIEATLAGEAVHNRGPAECKLCAARVAKPPV